MTWTKIVKAEYAQPIGYILQESGYKILQEDGYGLIFDISTFWKKEEKTEGIIWDKV